MKNNVAFLYADLSQYKKNPESFDAEKKQQLCQGIKDFLNDFVNDKIVFETDSAPELLLFLNKAAVFGDLKEEIATARKKLQQKLSEFDDRYGLKDLDKVPPETISKNIDKMNLLEQMPLTGRAEFRNIINIMSKIDLTDDDGNSLGQEGLDRILSTMLDIAKMDTLFCLLGKENLTVDDYFSVLHDALQINLINLFYVEELAPVYPLSDDMKEKAQRYMEKLLELIQ